MQSQTLLFLFTILLGVSYAVDYVEVDYCGSYNDGIRRIYQATTSICHDGAYYLTCSSNYDSVSLYSCNGNLIGTYSTGTQCTDGSPVWPWQVSVSCNGYLPSVPTGFAASTLYSIDSDCTSPYPLSSFRYPVQCQPTSFSNYSTMFCDQYEDLQLYTCTGDCLGCTPTSSVIPTQQCNQVHGSPSQVYSCGDVNIAIPQSSPYTVPSLISNAYKLYVYDLFVFLMLILFISYVL